jgi:hypothetical protein
VLVPKELANHIAKGKLKYRGKETLSRFLKSNVIKVQPERDTYLELRDANKLREKDAFDIMGLRLSLEMIRYRRISPEAAAMARTPIG